ncbi:MAG: spore germination protein, partial [Clostridiales bacterium]|nr:spore germination protein [Clostridiales bacterium]
VFIPAIYGAYKGVEVVSRLSVFIIPFVLLAVLIFFFMGLSKMDLSILQPVLEDSKISDINTGAFITGARYSEGLIFLVFSYFLTQKANFNKVFFKSLIVFGIAFEIIVISTITVLGVDYAKNLFNPYFVYIRQLQVSDVIQRVQAFNTLSWFPGILLKLSIDCFMASYIFSGIFNSKSHKKYVIPLAIISFLICMLPALQKTSVIFKLLSDQIFPFFTLPVTLVLPLLMMIMYFIRRKKIEILIEQKKLQLALAKNDFFKSAENETD